MSGLVPTEQRNDGNPVVVLMQIYLAIFQMISRPLDGFRRSSILITVSLIQFLFLAASLAVSPETERVPQDSWLMYATPVEAGFSNEKLAAARAAYDKIGAAGMLVVYDGAVLAAWGDVETRFMCHSVRKSFMSALYGRHVAAGRIDLHKTLRELNIDDIEPSLTDAEKQATVLDLLKSRSGIYHPAAYEPQHMKDGRPPRGTQAPGERWWYNNWDFNALLTIFEQETRTRFFEEFRDRLAVPLGMQDFRLRDGYYHVEPSISSHPAYPLRLSARDMARFGLLMMRGGRWGGRQIIPADWLTESTRSHSETGNKNYPGYGYLWAIARPPFDAWGMFSALGTGDNSIDILPRKKLVFVFRADTYHQKQINKSGRLHVIQTIAEAQTGQPKAEPKLIPLPAAPRRTDASAFAVNRRAELPLTLTPVIGPPLLIRVADGQVALFPGQPAGISYDLYPAGDDRFAIEGLNEEGVIERDTSGAPRRFLLLGHLLHAGREHLTKGDLAGAISTLAPVAIHFGESSPGQMWLGEAYRASGEFVKALGCFERALAAAPKGKNDERNILPLLMRAVKSAGDPSALDAFAGRYELTPNMITTVVRQAHRLVIQSPTGLWSTLVPDGAGTFRLLENPSVSCEFTSSDDSQVLSLLIRSGGQNLIHKRLP